MAKILIVDDHPTNRQVLVTLLNYAGHQTFEAADGAEALARARAAPPDLIISDIVMPTMDGYEFVRQLRAIPELAATCVVFYTATFHEREARQLSQRCGVEFVIIKPMEPVEMLKIVNQALGRAAPPPPVAISDEFHREHLLLLTNKLTQKANELEAANTELKKALAQLQAAQERLVQQERLHALGQMAGGIAHDFNNALAPILGFTELLLQHPDKSGDKETLHNFLEMINTSAKDAAQVVRGLREFYRHREQGEVFLPVNLDRLVEQVVMLTQPRWKQQAQSAGSTIQVVTELTPVPSVYGNESELREALVNLVFNAVDAMPGGGTLTLRTRTEQEAAVLEVRDSGLGMSEDVRQHCFEPFFTTKGEHGTGLGLAMVYGIIQRHDGSIEVESKMGEGTAFIIHLPVKTWQVNQAVEPEISSGLPALRVLVVDDEPVLVTFLTEFLESDGHAVASAHNGTEALEKFRQQPFDLVMTDRAMPGIGGEMLAIKLKQLNPLIPVIMLTGFGMERQANELLPAGVACLLSKPITLNELRQAIRSVIGKTA